MKMPEIEVVVKPQYLPDQSQPHANKYVYAYTIRIKNLSDEDVQLVSRYWKITDNNQRVQEVQGLGVVGEQPLLPPQQSYTYTSGVVLETTAGTMEGHYTMRRQAGDEFDTDIPIFALIQPDSLH